MRAKFTYTREEFEKIVLDNHEKFFPAPDGYKWNVGIGGYGSEVIIELNPVEKEEGE